MMQVRVYRDAAQKTVGFQVSGHAEYADPGFDIVCAAVSVLSQNAINSIEAFTEDEPDVLAINEEEGFLHYRLKTVSDASRLLLDSMVLGFESIKESYGKFIQINYEEV